MASPMLEGRSPRTLDPHKKAHFSLHISDRIAKNDVSIGAYTSVKYNHKPAQTTAARNATLTAGSGDRYALKLEDRDGSKAGDVFTFTGQRTEPKKSYVLIFDAATQKATLEPLTSTYTFNISTKNRADISTTHTKIYPKKKKSEAQDATVGVDDLFDETGAQDNENDDPDPNNPYDFRHFLRKDGEKRGDESEYATPSSPDYRTGTGSALNTPLLPARKPTTTTALKPQPKAAAPKPRKRKSPEADPLVSKPRTATTTKKTPAPTVRLERRATAKTDASSATARKKAAPAPSSRIKSAEIIEDSSSDADAASLASSPPARSPSPRHHHPDLEDGSREEDNVSEPEEDIGGGGLEIEVPDARPKPRHSALASLGLGQTLGLGGRSPSAGPISFASAANSVEGSPNPHTLTPQRNRVQEDEGVIDFGNVGGGSDDEDADGEEDDEGQGSWANGGGEEDRDVEPMDIGPPARKMSVGGLVAAEEDEDDILYKEMMQGLAGESSEESEEE
ncbi:hypothetical protein CC78DRAFT_530980 [Lojkania enalia]|uniref:Transcription elongation factor Eaf N-terminal domain-containing protein n=1 Tax=Lojkania enalia TaxID=147567 RepID=A0A9P4N2E7_9PLEO|nr:hypothetical protein CC78DRAFT_530980 [Didymosphaeria enalia]